MTEERYPKELYCEEGYGCDHSPEDRYGCTLPTDDGTMQGNLDTLAEKVVGHRIVSVQKTKAKVRYSWRNDEEAFEIVLDNGHRVLLYEGGDCCAYTALETFLLHPDKIDHIITGVGSTDGFTRWHIYADAGDVLDLTVGWSCGNPFYYGYGFDITVEPPVARR